MNKIRNLIWGNYRLGLDLKHIMCFGDSFTRSNHVCDLLRCQNTHELVAFNKFGPLLILPGPPPAPSRHLQAYPALDV